MKPIHVAAIVIVAATTGFAAPAAYNAVDAAAKEGVHFAHGWPGGKGGETRMMRHFGGRHVEGWIAFLKAELNITDEQLPQWTRLADTLRESATRMRAVHDKAREANQEGEERQPLTAVERLERWEKFAEAGLESVKGVNAAFKPLYEAMTDEQKKRVDRLTSRRHRR